MKKERWKLRAAWAPMLVLVLSALVGACGTDQPTGKKVTITSGPVPNAMPVGMSNCTSCHATATESWKLGRHGNLADGDLNGTGNPTLAQLDTQQNSAKCLSCHDALGDGRNQLVAGYTGNVPRPVVGCESCHGGGSEHSGVGPIARTGAASSGTGTSLQSSEFNTCTSVCHPTYGSGADYDFIAATHIDRTMRKHAAVPGDVRYNTGKNAGVATGESIYYVNKAASDACTACHNPHENTTVINKQYSRSKHGTPTDTPWTNYNWTYSDRSACQRCHTSTGFRNYANNPATYNPSTMNDYAYLWGTGVPTSSSTTTNPAIAIYKVQTETLYCWGCHTDYKGTLRNPGAITANYNYASGGKTYSVASYSYPDLAGSNVCMACHVGRQSGESIKNLSTTVTPTVDFRNLGFINSHYLAAGGTVFTATGYEFSNRIYDSPMLYMHGKIGTPGAPGTGSNGPCVGCHMSFTPEKHLFLPVTKLSTTDDTVVEVTSTVCSTCHTGGAALPMSKEMLEEQKGLLRESMEALKYQLGNRGYYFYEAHPYFYTAPYTVGYTETGACSNNLPVKNWQTGGTTTFTWNATKRTCDSAAGTAGTANTGKDNMGAAFNFNLIEHDPGAFAHNRFYAKRLIYDSIDWLDDNQMNYSVGNTLNTLCSAATPPAWCEGAKTYLLINGIVPNSSAERP